MLSHDQVFQYAWKWQNVEYGGEVDWLPRVDLHLLMPLCLAKDIDVDLGKDRSSCVQAVAATIQGQKLVVE